MIRLFSIMPIQYANLNFFILQETPGQSGSDSLHPPILRVYLLVHLALLNRLQDDPEQLDCPLTYHHESFLHRCGLNVGISQ